MRYARCPIDPVGVVERRGARIRDRRGHADAERCTGSPHIARRRLVGALSRLVRRRELGRSRRRICHLVSFARRCPADDPCARRGRFTAAEPERRRPRHRRRRELARQPAFRRRRRRRSRLDRAERRSARHGNGSEFGRSFSHGSELENRLGKLASSARGNHARRPPCCFT